MRSLVHIFNAALRRLGWKSTLCALLLCLLAASVGGDSANKELIVPYELREDFQGEDLGQWASYPPAQDIGYEPSLSPTADFDAPGGRALMRVIKPNRVSKQRFGFIKKVRMSLSSDSRVRFAYRLNSPGPGKIEVGLAAANGTLFKAELTASTNSWSVVDLPLARFPRAAAGPQLEAIYVIADLTQTDPDITYRLLIDDIAISGARAARFQLSTPKSKLIEPWRELVSSRSYRSGETIAVEAKAPTRLARIDCLLQAQNGAVITSKSLHDDGTHGDKVAGDGIWTNHAVHNVRSADQKGLWLAQLRGTTADGYTVNTTIRLMALPEKAESHPRLFFDVANRQKLIERSREPKLSSLWSHVLATAKSARATGELAHGGQVFAMLDQEYLLPSLLAYFDVLNRARNRIAYNSFEAYLTDSSEARAAAKRALLDVAKWQRWEPPWFRAHGQHTYYPAGLLAADVALGYDLLYDYLTDAERSEIRKALVEKSIIPTFKEYVLDNRLMANTSNWIAHTVGGALLAAACIADDLNEQERDGFDVYVGGLLLKLEDHMAASFLADGSYGEGISYQEFDLETLGPALKALRSAFRIDYWNQTPVLESLRYAVYTLAQPVSSSLDMGDTHPPAGHGISALVHESRDPLVRWYSAQFDRPSLSRFIFHDDSIQPQEPALPTSAIFSEKGNAVFRSGWGKDSLILLYRAGPTFNHNHSDQGSFLLNAFGENLVTEAGWSDYYKDPYYTTYFTQAIGHSTILVDGNPESQSIADTPQFAALNNYPRITEAITSDFHDSLSSELASVYQDRLERFTRRLVFVKPHYFVVFDDLVAKGSPARFDWLLHLPNRQALELSKDLALYRGKGAALAVRALAPDGCNLEVRTARLPYHEFAARTPATVPAAPGYLERSTGPLKETRFLTALIPNTTAEDARSLAVNMSLIKDGTWTGIEARRAGETDLVMFRSAAGSGAARFREWLTDAGAWTATESGKDLSVLSAHGSRIFSHSGRPLFSSNSPASFAVRFSPTAIEATVSVAQPAQIKFLTRTAPAKIRIDGRDIPASAIRYLAPEQTTQLSISAGQHQILVYLQAPRN